MAGLTGLDKQQGNYNYGYALDKIRQHTKDEKADIMDKPMDDEALKALIAQDILKNYGLGALEMFLSAKGIEGFSNAKRAKMNQEFLDATAKGNHHLDLAEDARQSLADALHTGRDAEFIPSFRAGYKYNLNEGEKLIEDAKDLYKGKSQALYEAGTLGNMLAALIPGATSIMNVARSLSEDETKKAAREANKKWLNKNIDDYRKKAGEAAETMSDFYAGGSPNDTKKRILNYSLGKGKLLPEDIETIRTARTEAASSDINKGE